MCVDCFSWVTLLLQRVAHQLRARGLRAAGPLRTTTRPTLNDQPAEGLDSGVRVLQHAPSHVRKFEHPP